MVLPRNDLSLNQCPKCRHTWHGLPCNKTKWGHDHNGASVIVGDCSCPTAFEDKYAMEETNG